MKSRRCRGFGLLAGALAAAGCQNAAKPSTTSKAPTADIKFQPTDDSRWQVTAQPTQEQLLAERTAAYAKSVNDDGTTPDPVQFDTSKVQFPPTRKIKKTVTIPLDNGEPVASESPAVSAPAPVVEISPKLISPALVIPTPLSPIPANQSAEDLNRTAQVASLKQAAETLGEGPQIVPESADFAAAKPGPSSTLDPLEFRLQKRSRENPRDVAAQLDLQLYSMLKDEPTPELATVTLLPPNDREMINTLVDGLTVFRSDVREDETMLQAKKIHPLLEMADRLRSQADLAVPTVALCRRVEGFGKYDPISPARFPAGRESKVIVYCEVENFQSKKIDSNWWETKLTEQVTIYTDTGQYVWADKTRVVADQSRRRRHDFYTFELLRLPADLTIGRYLLKVCITDENAGKVAEETVPVAIGAMEEANAER